MTSESVKKILVLAIGLSIQSVSVYAADVAPSDRYMLPPDKTHLETCRRNVMFWHPGTIEKQQMLHRHGDFWGRYNIQASDGSEWVSLCNLATGQIVYEQKLVDDAF